MSEWIVRVCVDTEESPSEEDLIELALVAEEYDASVSRWAAGPGYTLTMSVQADHVAEAVLTAIETAHKFNLTPSTVADLRVTTPEQYEAEALRPDFPPLASATDAAGILGVSRQRVHQLLASNADFPQPVTRVGSGPLWTVPAIEYFNMIWDRRPGRRPTATFRPLKAVGLDPDWTELRRLPPGIRKCGEG